MGNESDDSGPFSFKEILKENTENINPKEPAETVTATDGVKLTLRVYRPPKKQNPTAALVFYHGGGAHSLASYQHIGNGLSKEHNMVVYMPDLRGHGTSGGPRGDSPSSEQVLRDVNSVLDHVKTTSFVSEDKIFLGGHSSGGGLIVNYSSWSERVPGLAGHVLVSPELGYLSNTARPGRKEFGKVSVLPFILNGVFGVLGHSKAVRFQYPSSVVDDFGLVSYNTVNMANAITPSSPKDQFEKMSLPVGLWVGSEDELFLPEAVRDYVDLIKAPGKGTAGTVVPGETHLGILVGAHQFIGPWVASKLK